jgi:hypothetical protein
VSTGAVAALALSRYVDMAALVRSLIGPAIVAPMVIGAA